MQYYVESGRHSKSEIFRPAIYLLDASPAKAIYRSERDSYPGAFLAPAHLRAGGYRLAPTGTRK